MFNLRSNRVHQLISRRKNTCKLLLRLLHVESTGWLVACAVCFYRQSSRTRWLIVRLRLSLINVCFHPAFIRVVCRAGCIGPLFLAINAVEIWFGHLLAESHTRIIVLLRVQSRAISCIIITTVWVKLLRTLLHWTLIQNHLWDAKVNSSVLGRLLSSRTRGFHFRQLNQTELFLRQWHLRYYCWRRTLDTTKCLIPQVEIVWIFTHICFVKLFSQKRRIPRLRLLDYLHVTLLPQRNATRLYRVHLLDAALHEKVVA